MSAIEVVFFGIGETLGEPEFEPQSKALIRLDVYDYVENIFAYTDEFRTSIDFTLCNSEI